MSRSGYTENCDDTWAHIRWRGAVASAIRGKRGQSMLKELLVALDAMPVKSLATDSLINADGQYCTLGALGSARGMDMSIIDPDDRESVAKAFEISEALAAEIMYYNDDSVPDFEWGSAEICGPIRRYESRFVSFRKPITNHGEKRWQYMREWVSKRIFN